MHYLAAVLCALAILTGQYFYGGTLRPVFMLPSYVLVSLAGLGTGVWLFFKRPGGISWACFLSTTAFIGWMSWRCLAASNIASSEDFLKLLLACYIIYIVIARGVTMPMPRLVFVVILLVGALGQAVAGAAQFRGLWISMPQGWYSEQLRVWYEPGFVLGGQIRAHGLYLNANHLAWFLNAAGLFTLALGCFGRFRAWVKVLAIYVGVMLIVATLLCMSRGGGLALAAGVAAFIGLSAAAIWIGASTRRVAMMAIACAALIIPASAAWLVFDQSASIRFRMAGVLEDPYRPQIWGVALRQMQLEPLLGSGPGAFTYYARQLKDGVRETDDYFAHNDWAQIPADFGFPALALLIIAVLIHLSSGLRVFLAALRQRMAASSVPQSTSAALVGGALAASVAFSVHSFFDFNLQVPANALLAAACAGLLVDRRSAKADFVFLRYIAPIALIAVAVWLVMACWQSRYQIHALRAENAVLREEPLTAQDEIAHGLALNDRSPSLHRLLGEMFLKQKNYPRAVEEFRSAVRLEPQDSRNYLLLAQALISSRSFDGAEEAATEAIRLDPRKPAGYEVYALCREAQSDLPMAMRSFETSFILGPSPFGKLRHQQLNETLKSRVRSDTKK